MFPKQGFPFSGIYSTIANPEESMSPVPWKGEVVVVVVVLDDIEKNKPAMAAFLVGMKFNSIFW